MFKTARAQTGMTSSDQGNWKTTFKPGDGIQVQPAQRVPGGPSVREPDSSPAKVGMSPSSQRVLKESIAAFRVLSSPCTFIWTQNQQRVRKERLAAVFVFSSPRTVVWAVKPA